jgi:RHS repeat-associated protein
VVSAKGTALERSVSYEYDSAGRVIAFTNEEGHTFHTVYDAAGNLVRMIDALGNTVQENEFNALNQLTTATDAMGIETQLEYNNMGRVIRQINALNTERQTSTQFTHDNLGRVSTTTDAMGGVVSYERDEIGSVVQITDPNGGITRYSYDSMGRVTEYINAIDSRTEYAYNAQGLLASEVNARGLETTFTYLNNGWIRSFTDEIGTVVFGYDANGNILTVTDESGVITRTFDNMNRITSVTDARGNTIGYEYDLFGNITKVIYPDERFVTYTHLKTGELKRVTDWNGGVTSYQYNANGLLTSISRPDNSVETRAYDSAGRLTSQISKNGDTVIFAQDYTYNSAGNITNIAVVNPLQFANVASAVMQYNEFNQLVLWNGNEVFYDECGNMIFGPLGGAMVEFEYDARNRLIRAGNTFYEYNALGNRTAVIAGGTRTDFVTCTVLPLCRILTSTTDDVTTAYVWGFGLISQETEDEWLFYHFNNIGSTQALTGVGGEIVKKFEYCPYGNLTNGGTYGILFLYNGMFGIVSDSNGLLNMRARYYNPEIMRFLNPDPIKDGLNWYAYVGGNPVSYFDPFGLEAACAQGVNWGGDGGEHSQRFNWGWVMNPDGLYEPISCAFCATNMFCGCGLAIGGRDKFMVAADSFLPHLQDAFGLFREHSPSGLGEQTLSIDLGGNIAWGFRLGGGIQLLYDTHGGVGVAFYGEFGGGTPSLGGGANFSVIDVPRVEDVKGRDNDKSAGFSLSYFGVDFDNEGITSLNLGYNAIPGEFHGVFTSSTTPWTYSFW